MSGKRAAATGDTTLERVEQALVKRLDDRDLTLDEVLKISDRLTNIVKAQARLKGKDGDYGSGFDKFK